MKNAFLVCLIAVMALTMLITPQLEARDFHWWPWSKHNSTLSVTVVEVTPAPPVAVVPALPATKPSQCNLNGTCTVDSCTPAACTPACGATEKGRNRPMLKFIRGTWNGLKAVIPRPRACRFCG